MTFPHFCILQIMPHSSIFFRIPHSANYTLFEFRIPQSILARPIIICRARLPYRNNTCTGINKCAAYSVNTWVLFRYGSLSICSPAAPPRPAYFTRPCKLVTIGVWNSESPKRLHETPVASPLVLTTGVGGSQTLRRDIRRRKIKNERKYNHPCHVYCLRGKQPNE